MWPHFEPGGAFSNEGALSVNYQYIRYVTICWHNQTDQQWFRQCAVHVVSLDHAVHVVSLDHAVHVVSLDHAVHVVSLDHAVHHLTM